MRKKQHSNLSGIFSFYNIIILAPTATIFISDRFQCAESNGAKWGNILFFGSCMKVSKRITWLHSRPNFDVGHLHACQHLCTQRMFERRSTQVRVRQLTGATGTVHWRNYVVIVAETNWSVGLFRIEAIHVPLSI